jgi:cytochrome bd ubiquinol oxidase subunit II
LTEPLLIEPQKGLPHMEIIAVVLLAFFALGYLVLGGTDIGTGMVLPYLGRGTAERRLVITAIAPFFLGNEVWLVATAGVLAGAFPVLEGELLTGQFPVVVALLAGWVVRDMGLWLRGRAGGRGWAAGCDTAIVAGSWTVALSWGWLLAGLLGGHVERVATGPGAVLVVAGTAVLFAAHGLAFAALRLTGPPWARARAAYGRSGEPAAAAVTATGMLALGLAAGSRLPLAASAADPATLAALVPALLVVTPVLVAAQAWVWRTFLPVRVDRPGYL